MKRILLIGSYKNEDLRVGQFLSPSLGLYRIKFYVEKLTDYKVDVFDIDLKGKDELLYLVKKNKYDIIGFSILHPTLKNDIQIISVVKKISPHSLFIAGGQGAAFNYESLLEKTAIDVVVKGLGEFAVVDIIKNEFEFDNVKGIYFKKGDNIIDTGLMEDYSSEQFREISMLFDFSKVPYEEYWDYMKKYYSQEHLEIMKTDGQLCTIRIMTSTHCPRRCKFCSSTNFLRACTKNQQRLFLDANDINTLVNSALSAHPDCEAIFFNDDDFLFDEERIKKLCKLLPKNISYLCLSRIDNFDPELLKSMKKAGFKFIIYGVESFSNTLLNEMHKGISCSNPSELSKAVIKMTVDAGITPLMNLILFYPTTTVDEIVETIKESVELVKYGARLTAYTYVEAYPGADLLKEDVKCVYESVKTDDSIFNISKHVLPFSEEIKNLAEHSIELRDEIVKKMLKEYSWKGVVPHPIHSLALFSAVFETLGMDTSEINSLISPLFSERKMVPIQLKVKMRSGECVK